MTMARIPAPFGGPNAGLLSGCALAAMAAADDMAQNGAFGWQRWQASPAVSNEENFFDGNARLVEQVLHEVDAQIYRPSSAEAAAELACLLNPATVSSMISSHHSVSSVVRTLCQRANEIIEAAEERQQMRAEAATSLGTIKTKTAIFTIEDREGALRRADLTDADRQLIEARLRELRDLRDKTLDDLRHQFAYEDGAWKVTLGDAKRFVYIPQKSIRMADVKEVIIDGKRFYDVLMLGLPSIVGGKLVFEDTQMQRFSEDSDLIKKHGKDTDSLASTLMKMDSKTLLELIGAEKKRLEGTLEAAPTTISGGHTVNADELCTLSPNAAALNALPHYKKISAAPALTH